MNDSPDKNSKIKTQGEEPAFLHLSSETSLDEEFFHDIDLDDPLLESFTEPQILFLLSLEKRNWKLLFKKLLEARRQRTREGMEEGADETVSFFNRQKSFPREGPPRRKQVARKMRKSHPEGSGTEKHPSSSWQPYAAPKRKGSSKDVGEGTSLYKPGPRDIGRIRDWKPAKYDLKKDNRDFLSERLSKKKKKGRKESPDEIKNTPSGHPSGKFQVYKEGPRDIGRIKGWKPADYNLKDDNEKLFADRITKLKKKKSSPRPTKGRSKFKVYKQGPRDIGRNNDWKPANYDLKPDNEALFSERLNLPRQKKSRSEPLPPPSPDSSEVSDPPSGSKFKVHKQGPREVGRIKGWKPAKYDIKENSKPLFAERTTGIITKNTVESPKIHKPGPRETGRIKNWKPADYDIEDDGQPLFSERVNRTTTPV